MHRISVPDVARPRHFPSGVALFLLGAFLLVQPGCRAERPVAPEPVHAPAILEQVPHDSKAFTQGLLIDGAHWLESIGLYGRSELREVDRQSGRVLRSVSLPPFLFGEGLALFDGKLYQLTWREGVCLVYDRESFQVVDRFRYQGEGWGLTNCDTWLYMSDGSATIQVRDPGDFSLVRTFQVESSRGPVYQLNELEWINGEIWANIFRTRRIVRMDPVSGRVRGFLNLEHLPPPQDQHPEQDVMNGIAYDPDTGAIWLTGKNWKYLYRIAWPPQ